MADTPEQPPSFSTARRFGIGFHVLLSCVALFAIVVMLNYLGARYYQRSNWSSDDRLVLSPQTKQILAGLTNDVEVVIFWDSDEPLFDSVKTLLAEYRLAGPRVKVRVLDYLRNPTGAGQFLTKHKLSNKAADFVMFECAGRAKAVAASDLSNYDTSDLIAGRSREVKRTAFKGELMFTSAISSVITDVRPRAYFLEGHQESDPRDNKPDSNGFGQFAEMLQLNNVEASTLLLAGTNDVPADCQLLIIAGPRTKLDPRELAKLDNYLTQGGRMLVFLRDFHTTGEIQIEKLLYNWGVAVGNDAVRDLKNTVNQHFLLATNYTLHDITRPLAQSTLPAILLLPRTVSKRPDMPLRAEAPNVTELILTSEAGIAHTQFKDGQMHHDPVRDRQGALPLAVAVEKGALKDVKLQRGTTRIVVIGDVLFVENHMIDEAYNRQLGEKSVNWLLDRTHLLGGIGATPVKEFKLTMLDSQITSVRWIMLGVMPGSVLAFGLLVWWRRRH